MCIRPKQWICFVTMFAPQLSAQNANWTEQNPTISPGSRGTAELAYDSKHSQVVLFGGAIAGPVGVINDTWIWDGSSWTMLNPAQSPSGRSNSAVAYDSAHSQVVLFGGQTGNPHYSKLGDTWLWDGSNWTESLQIGPSARGYHAMAYDSQHGQVVMFGGADPNGNPLGDTWLWNGTSWTSVHPPSSPSPRFAHAMAYDSTHGQLVLFGGYTGSTSLSDTWLWDGTNWKPVTPQPSPSARCFHEMAYDSAHNQVILFGGGTTNDLTINAGLTNDTWLWDGSNWTQAAPANSPPARDRFGVAFDARHALAVLFGGRIAGNGYLGDTWTWSGGPVTTPPTVTSVLDQAAGTTNLTPGMPIQVTGTGFGNSSTDIATVTIGSEGAPVLTFNSSTSVIAQVPVDAPLGPNTLTVTHQGQPSMAFNITLVALAPEIEPAVSANGSSFYDSSGNPITSAHPAVADSDVYLLAIGLGTTNPPQVTNTVATAKASTTQQVQVMVGSKMVQPDYAELFVGGTPGYYQVSFKVPPDATVGNQPVTLLEGGLTSNMETLVVAPPLATVNAVVNGASFVGGGVVPGEIATAFGSNLTSATGINLTSGLPLQTTFLTDALMVNNQPVPLFAVDNVNGQQQINFQVPWEVAVGANAMIAVSNNGASGGYLSLPVLAAQPGIFNYSSGGETFGAILHDNFQLASLASPAKPGETVLIYCTGLGAVSSPPADGAAGNGQTTMVMPTVTIGGMKAIVSFSGLAPGFVGLYQINVEIPATLKAGNQPVVIEVGAATSNSVLLPLQ